MWRYLKVICTQAATIMAVRLFDMGMSWTQGELGFHPMAAGALAVVLILLPYVWVSAVDEDY